MIAEALPPDPRFTRAARLSLVFGVLAFPVGAVTLGFIFSSVLSAMRLRDSMAWIMLLAGVVLLIQLGLSVLAVRQGIAAKRLLPPDPGRRRRLAPVIGIGGGILGAVLIGGQMVVLLTGGGLALRLHAERRMEGRTLEGVLGQVKHADPSVREAAVRELGSRRADTGVFPVVAAAFADAVDAQHGALLLHCNSVLQSHAADADAPEAIPLLIALVTRYPDETPLGLANPGWHVLTDLATHHVEAVDALGTLGPAAAPALPRLREIAAGSDASLAARAAAAIAEIEKK